MAIGVGSHRSGTARVVSVVAAVTVLAACSDGQPPAPGLASPSAACEEAMTAAAEAGERADPESHRSPDLDALHATLEACASADEWLTAVRGHDAALPLELDRETALDQLCERGEGTPVCEDWTTPDAG